LFLMLHATEIMSEGIRFKGLNSESIKVLKSQFIDNMVVYTEAGTIDTSC
jgi:hypothetical protein